MNDYSQYAILAYFPANLMIANNGAQYDQLYAEAYLSDPKFQKSVYTVQCFKISDMMIGVIYLIASIIVVAVSFTNKRVYH